MGPARPVKVWINQDRNIYKFKNKEVMKRLLFFWVLIAVACTLWAQAPQGMKYQAVARDASGNVLANTLVSFRISLLSGSSTGPAFYTETHTGKSTNGFGLVDLVVGQGTPVTGTFHSVAWYSGSWYVKVEMDPAGGSAYQHMGTSQLLSVPYALHAKNVELEADGDASNEIQALSINGNQLSLSRGGGTVTLPSGGTAGDNWGTQTVATDASLSGNGLPATPLKVADGGVTSAKIADGNVATADLAANAVTSAKIADGSVAAADLADGAVTNVKMADGAVITNKLADGAVTAPKLASMGAAAGQVLTYSGTAWAPKTFAANPWLASGSDLYFNAGKVGIGKIPGADLRQFQVLTTGMQAVAAVNNSATYASIFAINEGTGPAAEFRSKIKILDGTQGAGKVLTSDAGGFASWQTPAANPWQKTGDNIFYTAGYVGIGTTATEYPLSIENASNTCYIKLKDNQGTGGARIGLFNGEMTFFNDNVNENFRFSINSGSGYFQVMTIEAANKRVGIGTSAPSATLDVEGTVAIGSAGKIFQEIREITGTTSASASPTQIAWPSGYTLANTRVLSAEINYNGTNWNTLGMFYVSSDSSVGCSLGAAGIYLHYPNVTSYLGRAYRILLMKVQ